MKCSRSAERRSFLAVLLADLRRGWQACVGSVFRVAACLASASRRRPAPRRLYAPVGRIPTDTPV